MTPPGRPNAARVTPPELADPRLFERREAVPILDEHVRSGRVVDAGVLVLVCRNSNARAEAGDPALLLIGHTDDAAPEVAQPPVVGYVPRFAMGDWRGRPAILADLYYARDRLEEALGYPRRSVEVYYSDDPARNYVDAVSLLVRTPERDLGLVTYARTGQALERYSLAACPAGPGRLEASDTGPFQRFMLDLKAQGIGDDSRAGYAELLRLFLEAKSSGMLPEQLPALTAGDAAEVQRYAARNGIADSSSALRRYKVAKARGKLWG